MAMNEKQVVLAKITYRCPVCDKLFMREQYIEQFKPVVQEYICRCIHCRTWGNRKDD